MIVTFSFSILNMEATLTREELEGMIAVVEEALKINPGHRTAQVSHNAMKILLEYWPSKKC